MDEAAAFRRVLDGALDAVVAFDRWGAIVGWNRAAERMFGHTKDGAMGCHVADLILTPDDRPRLERALSRPPGDLPHSLAERTVVDRAGGRIPVEASFS